MWIQMEKKKAKELPHRHVDLKLVFLPALHCTGMHFFAESFLYGEVSWCSWALNGSRSLLYLRFEKGPPHNPVSRWGGPGIASLNTCTHASSSMPTGSSPPAFSLKLVCFSLHALCFPELVRSREGSEVAYIEARVQVGNIVFHGGSFPKMLGVRLLMVFLWCP